MGAASEPASEGAPAHETATASPTPAAVTEGDAIEVAAAGEGVDTGEFEPSEFDGLSTASTSITSSVYHHSYENGRRYHQFRHGRYPIPNDDVEQGREDMKHALHLELTDGKLFFAPIGDNPQKILDLGTGTGIWAVEVADRYPSAEVVGIDLSPIQPRWVPPNLKFLLDDFEDEWMNGDGFDLAHLRWTSPMVKDVPKLLQRIFENLKPGGWIELQEFGSQILSDDDSLGGATLPQFFEKMAVAMESFGMKSFYIANELGPFLEAAGFTNVSLQTIKVPIGTWPKHKTLRLCGLYMKMNTSDFLAAMAAKPFLSIMSAEEAQVFAAHARKDLDNPAIHAYMNYRFWTGQKPV